MATTDTRNAPDTRFDTCPQVSRPRLGRAACRMRADLSAGPETSATLGMSIPMIRSLVTAILGCVLNFGMSPSLHAQTRPSDASLLKEQEQAADRLTQHTYPLRYKFRPGEVLRYEVVHQVQVKTTIDEQTQVNRSRSKSIKCWRITGADAQSVSFEHLIESVDMWSESQGKDPVQYNSQTDSKVPVEYEGVADVLGKPLVHVQMDLAGRVLKREDQAVKVDLGAGDITVPLPPQPVAIGSEWSAPSSVRVRLSDGQFKTMQTRQLYRLQKVASGIATISVQTQVLTPVPDARVESQIVQKLTNGELKFDIDAGRVVGRQLDWDESVVGFSGAASNMVYLARLTENLVINPKVAGNPSKPNPIRP